MLAATVARTVINSVTGKKCQMDSNMYNRFETYSALRKLARTACLFAQTEQSPQDA
jgi:hypothetical protein